MIVKNVEKKENNTAQFQVETDKAEFEAAVNGAYLKNRSSIYIPGFRKGKAPRAVVEGMYGAEVFYQDAMDELAPKAFEQGITESGLKFVGAPSIADVQVTEEKTVVYTFAVDLYPVVTLGEYKGLTASRDAVSVSDEAVDEEIGSVQRRNARMISVEREAQMGDTANIDFDGYLNGERFDGGKSEGYDLELGSNSFVPGFEEQIVGMTVGEEKDIDITFPEEYTAELAGKAVVFKVKLNSLTVAELPELDDDFAQDVSEFDTFAEYKASVREELEKRAAEQNENVARSAVMQQAISNMTVELPNSMVMEKCEEILRNYAANFGMTDRSVPVEELAKMMGMDDEALNTTIRPAAEFQVKQDLLVEAVVEAENISVTEEETEDYIARTAEKIGATADQLKEYFGMDFITAEFKKEKALDVIFDSAVITDAVPEEEKSAEE